MTQTYFSLCHYGIMPSYHYHAAIPFIFACRTQLARAGIPRGTQRKLDSPYLFVQSWLANYLFWGSYPTASHQRWLWYLPATRPATVAASLSSSCVDMRKLRISWYALLRARFRGTSLCVEATKIFIQIWRVGAVDACSLVAKYPNDVIRICLSLLSIF